MEERGEARAWAAYLVVLEARADVAELLVDAEALLLLVVAVAYVADEDRQPPHPRERHPLRPSPPPPPRPPPPLLGEGKPPDLRAAARDLADEEAKPCLAAGAGMDRRAEEATGGEGF